MINIRLNKNKGNEKYKNYKKKIIKVFYILIIFIIYILILNNESLAEEIINIDIITDSYIIEKGQNFEVTFDYTAIQASSLTSYIHFDQNKIEYIEGPENSNVLQNEIIYSWFDETGEMIKNTKKNTATFIFKAKEAGTTSISINGEYFDFDTNLIKVEQNGIELNIFETNNTTDNLANIEEELEFKIRNINNNNTDENSSYLQILRINEEGINPDFEKENLEYYFLANENINNLEITAIPENSEALVEITGNKNLIEGLNKIEIKITSKNKQTQKIYKIYVTKTSNFNLADANLENLAIENIILEPEFNENIINYKISIPTNFEKLNILAVTKEKGASIKIEGNENLQYGNNTITILVTAPNKFTNKKYTLQVYKRNEEEEIKKEEEQKIQIQKVNAILEEKAGEAERIKENSNQLNIKDIIIIISLISILIIFIIYKMKQ